MKSLQEWLTALDAANSWRLSSLLMGKSRRAPRADGLNVCPECGAMGFRGQLECPGCGLETLPAT